MTYLPRRLKSAEAPFLPSLRAVAQHGSTTQYPRKRRRMWSDAQPLIWLWRRCCWALRWWFSCQMSLQHLTRSRSGCVVFTQWLLLRECDISRACFCSPVSHVLTTIREHMQASWKKMWVISTTLRRHGKTRFDQFTKVYRSNARAFVRHDSWLWR